MNRKLSSSKQKARRKDHLFFLSDLLLVILDATLAARNGDSSSGKLHAPYDNETYRFHDHETQSERRVPGEAEEAMHESGGRGGALTRPKDLKDFNITDIQTPVF